MQIQFIENTQKCVSGTGIMRIKLLVREIMLQLSALRSQGNQQFYSLHNSFRTTLYVVRLHCSNKAVSIQQYQFHTWIYVWSQADTKYSENPSLAKPKELAYRKYFLLSYQDLFFH